MGKGESNSIDEDVEDDHINLHCSNIKTRERRC